MRLPSDHILRTLEDPGASWDVLAFIGSLNVGGCEKHLATVYPRLAAAGLKVGIVTFERGGPLEKELRVGGVDVMCSSRPPGTHILSRLLGYLWPVTTVLDISRLLRSGRVGVAHFYLPGAYIFGGLGALLAGHSNSIMSRRSLNDYQADHRILSRIERFLHRRMRLLLANAQPVLDQLIAEGAPPDRTLLLYSGVDLEPPTCVPDRAAARNRFGLKPDQLAIGIVANLIPYKGHADLVEALARLSSRTDQKWVLLVAGRDDGPGRALKERAEFQGIASNIRWLGSINDVPTLWRAADIGVLASHQEGLPNSLLEAMAMGVPTVTTNVGGVVDIVTNGVDALVVPPRNPEAIAEALLAMIESPELRLRLGGAATARVHGMFSLQRCVDAYQLLYESMLHRPRLSSTDIARRFQSGSVELSPLSAAHA
jgi:glycosyltransferase involved in cell wall biosynthesis